MNGDDFTAQPFLQGQIPITVNNFNEAFPPALAFGGNVAQYHLLGHVDPADPVPLHAPYDDDPAGGIYHEPTARDLIANILLHQPKIIYLDPINLRVDGRDVPIRCLYRRTNGLILSVDAEMSDLDITIDADDLRENRFQQNLILAAVNILTAREISRFRTLLRKIITFFVRQHKIVIDLDFSCTGEFVGYNLGANQVNSLISVFSSIRVTKASWKNDKDNIIDQVIDHFMMLFADHVQDDQLQAGSDEIIAEVHTIFLREMRVMLRAKGRKELILDTGLGTRPRYPRVLNPLIYMNGACGKDFMPSEQYKCIQKHLVPIDTISVDMFFMRWNCGLRCLLYAKNVGQRLRYQAHPKDLAEEAIELRKQCRGIVNGEGPISVSELLEISRQLNVRTFLSCWIVGHGLSEEISSHDEDSIDLPIAYILNIANHYVLARDSREWSFLRSDYMFCKKCSKLRSRDNHDTVEKRCKGQRGKGKRSYSEDVPPKTTFKSIVPLNNKVKTTSKNKMVVCDFETWRKKTSDGKIFHQVYASAIQIGIDTLDFDRMVVFYGEESLRLTCKAIQTLAFKTDEKDPYFLYFYNGSGFDNVFLLECFIKEMNVTPDNVVLKDGRIMAASFFGGCIHLRDLYLFTRCKLSDACKSFGVPDEYCKGDFDHEKMKTEADLTRYRDECIAYLKNDITATSICLNNFWDATYKEFGIDFCTNLTSSHMAFDCWRKTLSIYHLYQLKLPRTSAEDAEMRRAYYGGRVFPGLKAFETDQIQDLYRGLVDYTQLRSFLQDLDVASLYPAAMAGCDGVSSHETIMPYFCGEFSVYNAISDDFEVFFNLTSALTQFQSKLDEVFGAIDYATYISNIYQIVGLDVHRFYRDDQGFRMWRHDLFPIMKKGAIVTVDLHCPADLKIPLMPAKTDKGAIQWDLTAKKNQSYSLDELVESLVFGYRITHVHQAIIFNQRRHLFKTHIQTNFEMKKQARRGEAKRDIAKNNMNHTYGKFGQEIIKTKTSYRSRFQLEQMLEDDQNDIVSIQPILDNSILLEKSALPATLKDAFAEEITDNEVFEEMLDNLQSRDVVSFKLEQLADSLSPTKPVYIALQTTANSHMIMNRYLILLSLIQNKSFAYTDTDSLVVENRYVEVLKTLYPNIIGKELGKLDDELEGGKVWAFYAIAPKFYCLCYMMPNNKSYLKIRTKGFPHFNKPILMEPGFIEKSEKAAEPFLSYAEEDGEDPEEGEGQPILKGLPYFNPDAEMPLGTIVYSITNTDGRRYYVTQLNHLIYKDMVSGNIKKLRVFFTSMKRHYDNAKGCNIAAIEHVKLSRSLNPLSWWNSPTASRKTLDDNIFGETYPRGHYRFDSSDSTTIFGEST